MSRRCGIVRLAGASVAVLFAVLGGGSAALGQQSGDEKEEQVVFQPVGVTGHSWGAWVTPGAAVGDWVARARGLCAEEDLCEVRVFEGPELATHENPVPEANRAGLKWVFRYQHNETPRIVVEEAGVDPSAEKRTWTFKE